MTLFLRQFPGWLRQGRYFLLSLATITGLVGLVVLWPDSDSIRYAGLIFQLAGIGLVLIEIRITGNEHGALTWRAALKEWWSKRPNLHPNIIAGSAAVSAGVSMASGRGKVRWPTKPDAEATERIGSLEKNLQFLDEAVDQVFREFDEFRLDQRREFASLKSELGSAKVHLEGKLKVAATGRLSISALSAIWLIIGVVLATVPAEIADGLTRLHNF